MLDYINSISIFQVLISFFTCALLYNYGFRDKKHLILDKIPGPRPVPLFGNTLIVLGSPPEAFKRALSYCKNKCGMTRGWVGNRPLCAIYKAAPAEVILSSYKYLDKAPDYKAMHPWLGTGLLTSTGAKWHQRRKMLTPTFHFKILEDYMEIFNQQSEVFVKKLQSKCGSEPFNIYPYITLCTLDIIMETAMGHKIDAQNNPDSDYVTSIYVICLLIMEKLVRPWMQIKLLSILLYRDQMLKQCLGILHGFSIETIKDRRKKREQLKLTGEKKTNDEVLGKKKRLAFLDLLLEFAEEQGTLSDEDIREEVDTFMFEGHDTTAAAVNWTLYLLGQHPEIQDKVYEEIESIFGKDDRYATASDLREMKYLECCIKESLRLFPSVPLFARDLHEDAIIDGYTIPKDTIVIIFTYQLHRDPEAFPDPNAFKPERFFPENSANRHPYAFVPFSAGPRNCIGQKFAMMEEKVVISSFLRKYRIESMIKMKDLKIIPELILRSEEDTLVKIFPRH